jgi:hypothetical protein
VLTAERRCPYCRTPLVFVEDRRRGQPEVRPNCTGCGRKGLQVWLVIMPGDEITGGFAEPRRVRTAGRMGRPRKARRMTKRNFFPDEGGWGVSKKGSRILLAQKQKDESQDGVSATSVSGNVAASGATIEVRNIETETAQKKGQGTRLDTADLTINFRTLDDVMGPLVEAWDEELAVIGEGLDAEPRRMHDGLREEGL